MHKSVCAALLAVLAGTLAAVMPATAETYKWTDADGKVHYSDQPPPPSVKNSTTMSPKKRTSRSAPAAAPEAQSSPDAAAGASPKPAAGDSDTPKATGPKTPQELDAEFKQRQVKAAEEEAARRKADQELAEKNRNCQQARQNVARLEAGGRMTRYNDKGELEYLGDEDIAAELARARQIADSWCK